MDTDETDKMCQAFFFEALAVVFYAGRERRESLLLLLLSPG